MNRTTLSVISGLAGAALLGLAVSCAGQGRGLEQMLGVSRLGAPRLLAVGATAPADQTWALVGKGVDSAPLGIYVTWVRDTNPLVQGYYLYRNTESFGDLGPEDYIDPQYRVNDGNLIEQPADGETVTFNDYFEAVVGTTYYYRLTTVDIYGGEGYASNERSWTVYGHSVTGLDPTSAYYGDSVTLTGDTFGEYDPVTDSVLFVAATGGEVAGAIESWNDTEIVATVPVGAADGKLSVVINATVAQTDETLEILNPYITQLDPAVGFVEQSLTIHGANFSEPQGDSTVMLGTADISGAVTLWSPGQISVDVPVEISRGDVVVTVEGHPSNGVEFTPRAEILSVSPSNAQAGEVVQLSGRFFGGAGLVLLDGEVEQLTQAWADDSLSFVLAGEAGLHVLTIETVDGVVSNELPYQIVDSLWITMSGLDEETIYRPSSVSTVSVSTPADVEYVGVLSDGEYVNLVEGHVTEIDVPVGSLTNGVHEIKLAAWRRMIVAESAPVTITVYSLVGDVNADGQVGLEDRDALRPLIGLTEGDEDYRLWYDTNLDGEVNEADLAWVGYQFAEKIDDLPEWPPPPPPAS